jgi:triacylglycerol lipase
MTPVAFDPRLALDLALHAQAVYLPAHEFALWALDHADGSDIIPRRSTQVGITYSPRRIVVVARGSSQWGDWGENFLALRARYRALFPVGRVHLGFQIQARRIAAEFRRTIAKLRQMYPAAEVYVTGHSLGGALCAFLLRLLDLDNVPVMAVYTFESPRVGDEAFSSWYDGLYGDATFRVVAIREGCADIVTRLPPSALGWRHVGRPIMICDGHLYESEAAWQAARSAHPVAPLPWWRIGSRLATGVGAHLCGPLVEELSNFVPPPQDQLSRYRATTVSDSA